MARKLREGRACLVCGILFNGISFKARGRGAGRFYYCHGLKACSESCTRVIHEASARRHIAGRKGPDHPRWTGYRQNKGAWRGSAWQKIAESVRESQGRRCADCGKPEGKRRLDVHHKEPFHNFPNVDEANRRQNLVALCRSCHAKADAGAPRQVAMFDRRPGKSRGERVNTARLDRPRVLSLRADRAGGMSIPALAAKYGLANASVWAIVHRRSWRHV